MINNKHYLAGFLTILFLWLFGSQEMYINKWILTNATFTRYLIYFSWLLLVAITGYVVWYKHPQKWIGSLWIFMYTITFLLLVLLGIVDLFIFPFTRTTKNYIQTFRLFVQSPVPFVLIYLYIKITSTEKSISYHQ